MAKFPINGVLWLSILGLGAAGGYEFWQAMQEKLGRNRAEAARQEQTRKISEEAFARGETLAGRQSVGPAYDRDAPFWNALKDANLIGKEPEKPPEQMAETKEPEPEELPQTPLEDIVSVVLIAHDGDESRVVLRYKPAANVQPPADVVAAPPITDVVPSQPTREDRNARGPRATSGGMPTFQQDGYTHHLKIDETLWPPFEHIRLVRVAADAREAFFQREDPNKPKEEWPAEESLVPELLDLPQAILQKLRQIGVDVPDTRERPAGAEQPAQVEGTDWQATEETVEVATNRFNIGTRDREVFRSNPDRIFNEDIATRDWRSRRGDRRGVLITRLKPGYERYGIRPGDIVLAINGEPVSSKQQAYKIGKRFYERGVRTFEVEFLTASGQRITRTYVAPDEE